MAVDTKSQHVGNHGGAYTDNDGMRKQFTVIDHDKKPTVSRSTSMSDKELEEIKQRQAERIIEKLEFILQLPALNIVDASGGKYNILVQMDGPNVVWIKDAVKNHLESDINSFLPIILWRRTVPEAQWFNPITEDLEAIKRGEWKNLIP